MTTDHLPNRLVDRIPRWARRASCRRHPELEWVLDDPYQDDPAPEVSAVCGACPVRGACLRWALDYPSETSDGVYGGLTPLQRKRIMLEKLRTVCPGCESADVLEREGFCLACGLSWLV